MIFCDTASGAHAARPGLEACLRALAPGDMLVVWRLDRLGRSMAHLVTLIEGLLQRQVGFRSLSDGAIDTTTASGELVFHIFSALAQFERRLIQERTPRAWPLHGRVAAAAGAAPSSQGTPRSNSPIPCMLTIGGPSRNSVPPWASHVPRATAMWHWHAVLCPRANEGRVSTGHDSAEGTAESSLTVKISRLLSESQYPSNPWCICSSGQPVSGGSDCQRGTESIVTRLTTRKNYIYPENTPPT